MSGTGSHHSGGKRGEADLVLFPMRAYHLRDAAVVMDELSNRGVTTQAIETDSYRGDNEEVRREANALGIKLLAFQDFIRRRVAVRTVVLWNDWDPLMRVIAQVCHHERVAAVGWVEGVNDYGDVDTGRRRFAYRRSRHVIVPGDFDRKYFRDTGQDVHTGEVVRIGVLWRSRRTGTGKTGVRRALINSNFSYGVLVDDRDRWLSEAVDACLSAGIEPVISRHPFDTGTSYTRYETSTPFVKALQDCVVTIQRFGSGILEALAVGVPVIYFNPHGERVDKFKDPRGAYLIASTRHQLRIALQDEAYRWEEPAAEAFLELHSGLSAKEPPGSAIANALERVVGQTAMPTTALAEGLRRHPLLQDRKRLPWQAQAIGPIYLRADELAASWDARIVAQATPTSKAGPPIYASFGDWLKPRFPRVYRAMRLTRRRMAAILRRAT